MTPHPVPAWRADTAAVLLTLGVAVELLCCLGLVRMRRAAARLHYLTPSTLLGPPLIAAAVIFGKAQSQAETKAVLIALTLLLTGPIAGHAIGRAIHRREAEGDET